MSAINYRKTRLNGNEKFLDLKINLQGAIAANANYEKIKTRTDYLTKLKPFWPTALKFAGTVATVKFTPSVSPVWTVDELKDKYAVMWKQADTTALETSATQFHEISLVDHQVQKIVSNTATDFTVGATITTGYTAAIILDEAWFNIAQVSNYDFANSKAQIDTNDADSGGVESFILGLESAALSGTGHFMPTFHTMVQINKAKDSGAELEVRHGATTMTYDTVYNQTVLVNDFTKTGSVDGTGKLEYNLAFSNVGDIQRQTILVDGVVPDFM